MTAVTSRITKAPVMEPVEQDMVWHHLSYWFEGIKPFHPIEWENYRQHWLDSFKDEPRFKYLRAQRALKELEAIGFIWPTSVELNLKRDEVLPYRTKGYKARTIHNVSPSIQAFVGPVVYKATKNFKKFINKTSRCFVLPNGMKVKARFASSADDLQLTCWREEAMLMANNSAYMLIAGDDVVLWHKQRGTLVQAFEFDVSSMDQSQSTGPLNYEYACLRWLGVSKEVVDVLRGVSSLPLARYDKNRIKILHINRDDRPFRDTGGPDTTLGNSLVMLTVMLEALRGGCTDDLIIKCALSLGFELTGGSTPLGTESFLKGLWYPCGDTAVWGPGLCRIIKIGKSICDPRLTYTQPDLTKACLMHARDVANTYAAFVQIPILEVYVSRFKDSTIKLANDRVDTKWRYKVLASGRLADRKLDRAATLEILNARYGVTLQEVNTLSSYYSYCQIGDVCFDEAFWKISERDYGD